LTWQKGRETLQALIDRGELERVTASGERAAAILADARRHLSSAKTIAPTDPQGAYSLTYDGARKSLAAILEAQGLRATSKGGHIVLYDVALAQFDPPLGKLIRPFNRMRARRNQIEYASSENPEVTKEEVVNDIAKAEGLISLADRSCHSSTPSDMPLGGGEAPGCGYLRAKGGLFAIAHTPRRRIYRPWRAPP
jgi:hypothetical protein